MTLEDRVETEVRELHSFFERWYNGSLPREESEFVRLRSAWSTPFTLRDPFGALHAAEKLVGEVHAHHGAYPSLQISISEIGVACGADGARVVAEYVESHLENGQYERRICRAEFAADESAPNGVRWVRLDEWHPESSRDAI